MATQAQATAKQILAAVVDDLNVDDLMERRQFANLSADELTAAVDAVMSARISMSWHD